ncbi:hypothetical protein K7472_15695 [Streptomyces sp. PTM05]|uniref:Uncharacterized protein n=1 Tax=Streptantibioticus parmotrematis TaxID=2873249 RepID=A0ABS7QSY6_9ACTN|nr:hypothetical protein [Streptantibioticus parmotrematis]MBY8886297.1 hypothetical protein [Streptantibioticus parmotrematis]
MPGSKQATAVTVMASRRGWKRLLRVLPRIVLVVVGAVVFAPGTDESLDADIANLWLAAALPVWWLALTLSLWRAPERGLPDVLRFRRRHRRVCWRLSALLLLGACLALLTNAYCTWKADSDVPLTVWEQYSRYASHAGTTGVWLLCLSPLPGLLDPLVWRLWPAPLRHAVRRARAAEALASPGRYPRPVPFDPDRGAVGRPEPLGEDDGRRGPSLIPVSVRLSRDSTSRGVELRWNGATLTLHHQGHDPVRLPVAPRDDVLPGEPLPRPVAEVVWYDEQHNAVATRTPTPYHWRGRDTEVLFLDADGRRLGTVSRVLDDWQAVARVARAAGVPFAAYDLGYAAEDEPRAASRLFPRDGRQLTVRAE